MTKKLMIAAIVLMTVLLAVIGIQFARIVSDTETETAGTKTSEKVSAEKEEKKDIKKEEEKKESSEQGEKQEQTEEPEQIEEPEPEKTSESYTPSVSRIDGESSEFYNTDSLLVVANKKHRLPEGYEPADLAYPWVDFTGGKQTMRWEAAEAIEKMFEAADNDGVHLLLQSGYRSAAYQNELYSYYEGQYGTARADAISSRPGYSDHQTGLAADIGSSTRSDLDLTQDFIDTVEGQWLYNHAHEYGFIMRYPVGKQDITGYAYEPWHYRYIGVSEAKALKSADPDMSFEEYYNVAGGDYAD